MGEYEALPRTIYLNQINWKESDGLVLLIPYYGMHDISQMLCNDFNRKGNQFTLKGVLHINWLKDKIKRYILKCLFGQDYKKAFMDKLSVLLKNLAIYIP